MPQSLGAGGGGLPSPCRERCWRHAESPHIPALAIIAVRASLSVSAFVEGGHDLARFHLELRRLPEQFLEE